MPRNFDLDFRHDIEFMNNNSKHGDINTIVHIKSDNSYHARVGVMLFALNAKTSEEVQTVLDHVNNALDIIPLVSYDPVERDGVRVGTFYKEGNGTYSLKTTSTFIQ